MPLADIAFLVRSASVSGPFGGGTDGLLSANRGLTQRRKTYSIPYVERGRGSESQR
jgi:hypothetical protein